MKEYNTNLMKTTWGSRRILLMILLMAFDLLMTYTISQNGVFPVWLNATGVLLASCIGGPAYGVILAIIETVIEVFLGGGLVMLVKGIAMIAVAAAFGTYVRLGFFGNIRGVLIGILSICFIDTCIRTPEFFALFGSFTSNNMMGKAIIETLTYIKLPLPFVSAFSFFVMDLIDKAVILFAIYGIVKNRPQTIAKLFAISEPLPQCVIVKDSAEEEFQSEKEQLMAKAQKKLEQKKIVEESKTADTSEMEQKQ